MRVLFAELAEDDALLVGAQRQERHRGARVAATASQEGNRKEPGTRVEREGHKPTTPQTQRLRQHHSGGTPRAAAFCKGSMKPLFLALLLAHVLAFLLQV